MKQELNYALIFKSYQKQDLKRQFLFFKRIFKYYLNITVSIIVIWRLVRLVSLLRSSFVHKKFFEQFLFINYTNQLSFSYIGDYNRLLEEFLQVFIQNSRLFFYFSKIKKQQKSSFFY